MFRKGEVHKTYWAIVQHEPAEAEGLLTNWLVRNERQNKTYAYDHEVAGSKKAMLRYKVIGRSDRYVLLEIHLLTGRHHQIRTQLAHIGCPIKGDLKYGAPRSNVGGGISLQSHRICFEHPVSHIKMDVTAPVPNEPLWQALPRVVSAAPRCGCPSRAKSGSS